MSENLHFTEALQKEPAVVLTRYLEGELSVEETQQLEQVMAEDPFMADALEGLRSMPEPARAMVIGQELKFKAHKLLRSKRPIISLFHFNQYATAAVAVLVILFVATAAIMLTSRLQQSPQDTKAFTENVIEKPEEKITENLPSQAADERNTNTTPVPVPQKTEVEKESKGEMDINTVSTPDPKPYQPTNERKEPAQTPTTITSSDRFADEKVAEEVDNEVVEEEQAHIGNAVTMESEDNLPPDPPTLSKERLESYKQALTEGEYTAYKQALTKLENSLLAVNDPVLNEVVVTERTAKENIGEMSSRTGVQAGGQDLKALEREERKRTREQERNAKKRADRLGKDARINDSVGKNEDLVDRDRRNQETEVDDAFGYDDFEVNENLLKQQLYTNPTDGENWLKLGQYYMTQNQYLKAEPYLKGAASSGKLSVVQEANKLLKEIKK